MEKKWLKYLEAEHSITLTSTILEDLTLIVKKLALENSKETVVIPSAPVLKVLFQSELENAYLNV